MYSSNGTFTSSNTASWWLRSPSGDEDGDPGFADSGESGYERNHADSSDDFDGEDKSFANGSAFEADGSIVHQDSLDWYVSSDGFNRFIQYTYD